MTLFKKLIRKLIKFLDLFAKKKILVLGDSHAQIFMFPLIKWYFPLIKFDVCSVGGATASGLENPNSKTQAYKKFRRKLLSGEKYCKIILLLGEVDTGFVIWYRAEKYKVSLDEMYKDAISKYTKFIKETSEYGETIVISTPLPTITDDNDWGEVANLRKEVKAKQIERTKLTLKFNQEIEKFCLKNGINFVNLDKQSLGPNGLVKKALLNKNKLDHHYNKFAYTKLIVHNIKKVI